MRRVKPMTNAELFKQMYGLDDYTVEWTAGFPLALTQQDAAFYCDGSASSLVCTVKKNGFQVDIYCDGEMRARLNRIETVRRGDEFEAYGVKTDADLSRLVEDFVMNPWFDLYVYGEHLDAVEHEIADAIKAAKAWLDDCCENANQIENGVLDLPAL
jgi:hypothetical protein